jgi:hypothetical protein
MKYLIVKCEELLDQYECDCNRVPFKMVNDYSSYGHGYEIYELNKDNTFRLIKEYDSCLEEGIGVYKLDENDKLKKVYEKHKNMTRDNIPKSQLKKWKHSYGFQGTIKEIYESIEHSGGYGEIINNEWTVIGEYYDDCYSSGY